MGKLTQSLQNEIREKPENFYLTFDIYDLLFDWFDRYSLYDVICYISYNVTILEASKTRTYLQAPSE